MKRQIIFASIMMLAAGAYAQHEVGSVTFQPKVGMNIANFRDIRQETMNFTGRSPDSALTFP